VAGNLLMATGRPGDVTRARAMQLAVFVPAVIGLGHWYGIGGVAVAADLMVLVGVVLLFARTRHLVDYSVRVLWLWPIAALTLTMVGVLVLADLWGRLPLWGSLLGKSVFISLLYGSLLWLTEREQIRAGWQVIRRAVRPLGAAPGFLEGGGA
jgi:O-antigen/teichoic acid export membrane protein